MSGCIRCGISIPEKRRVVQRKRKLERDVAVYPGFAAGSMYWQLKHCFRRERMSPVMRRMCWMLWYNFFINVVLIWENTFLQLFMLLVRCYGIDISVYDSGCVWIGKTGLMNGMVQMSWYNRRFIWAHKSVKFTMTGSRNNPMIVVWDEKAKMRWGNIWQIRN